MRPGGRRARAGITPPFLGDPLGKGGSLGRCQHGRYGASWPKESQRKVFPCISVDPNSQKSLGSRSSVLFFGFTAQELQTRVLPASTFSR